MGGESRNARENFSIQPKQSGFKSAWRVKMLFPLVSPSIDSLDENSSSLELEAKSGDEFIYLCGVKRCCFRFAELEWKFFQEFSILQTKFQIENATAIL